MTGHLPQGSSAARPGDTSTGPGRRRDGDSVYFSVDIEADGTIPGPFSMLSIGAALVGYHDEAGFQPVDDVTETVFYRELQPISDQFDPRALQASGLDREALFTTGAEPSTAMRDFSAWTSTAAAGRGKPVFVAYPGGYDWMFTYWYLMRFAGRSVFGHGRVYDIKSAYAAHTGRSLAGVVKATMPRELMSDRPHTHRADEDAIEQAELFINVMREIQAATAGRAR
jgi:hypothetical protein